MPEAGTEGTAHQGGAGATHGGGTGGLGEAGSGSAGEMQQTSRDPCAALPAGCFPLCEGGQCQCECPDAEPCPASAPTENAPCNTVQLCGYGEPACHQIFECFTSVWKKIGDTCIDVPDGSCPATLDEALATPCLARSCGYDAQICQCASPACSGAFMEPSTMCAGATPAACIVAPAAGANCLPEGQRCGASCCGQQFTCTDGTWVSAILPCPP